MSKWYSVMIFDAAMRYLGTEHFESAAAAHRAIEHWRELGLYWQLRIAKSAPFTAAAREVKP